MPARPIVAPVRQAKTLFDRRSEDDAFEHRLMPLADLDIAEESEQLERERRGDRADRRDGSNP